MSTVVAKAVGSSSVGEVAVLRGQLEEAQQRIVDLEGHNVRLEGEVERLSGRVEQQASEIERLRGRVEEERRAGKRQAAPFSRGEKKKDPARPGRKPGADYGPKSRRRPPEPDQVDETIEVGLPDDCLDCGDDVVFDEMREQFQQEFVPAHSRMRRFEVALGHCSGCRRRVRSRHPEQTSDALGAAGVMLGPRAHALAAWLHVGLGVPMGKVAQILKELGGIEVTAGGLHSALHKTAGDAASTFDCLLESLRNSNAVAADETGWRIDGERGWLWVYVGDEVTVYDIAKGRGYTHAEQILGAEFDGVLERDGWAPYRKFVHAQHQSCLAHLLRRCHELIEDATVGAGQGPPCASPHPARRARRPRRAARRTAAGRPCDRPPGTHRRILCPQTDPRTQPQAGRPCRP
jgi:transposase